MKDTPMYLNPTQTNLRNVSSRTTSSRANHYKQATHRQASFIAPRANPHKPAAYQQDTYQPPIHKQSGYTVIELSLSLAFVLTMLLITFNIHNNIMSRTPAQTAANQAYNYAHVVIRYITTHQNQLRDALSINNQSNGKLVTITPQVLFNEGFLKEKRYFINKLNQMPCTVIWYDKQQLQSLIYYRDNNNPKKLNPQQWASGLHHMGAMLGLYTNNQVLGSAQDWLMDSVFINSAFFKQGTADISNGTDKGTDPSTYICPGSHISQPSYIVNVTSMLTLDTKLPKDNTIHQYPDNLHNADTPQSNNRMNGDVNMDYINESGVRTQSNVIFQMNPDCQMNPNDPPTMQDYSPIANSNTESANPRGCKNRQLAIQVADDPTNNRQQKATMITGFQKAGQPALFNTTGVDKRPYLGEIKAASFQPTLKQAVGTACDQREVGTMSGQLRSPDPDDVNNVYVGMLMCMRSPLCEEDTKGYCYMPTQSVTYLAHPNSKTYTCPVGTFIDDTSLVLQKVDINKQTTCVANKGSILYPEVNCFAEYPTNTALERTDPLNTALKYQQPIYRTITVKPTQWQQRCMNGMHLGCGEGPGQIAPTQDIMTAVQCINDPSKASIVIRVP